MIAGQLRIIFSCLAQHAGTKLLCHASVGAWIVLVYYGPQVWPWFPAQPAPALSIDRWVPFQPAWALVYQSVFLVHTLAFWLPCDRAAVRRYSVTVAAAFASGAVVFWLYPTVSPRPEYSDSTLLTWLITSVDGRRNAFPSLHAAMGLLAVSAVAHHLRACRASAWWRIGLALWWVALLYSTLATRQHRLLDLVAGTCLGLFLLVLSAVIIRTRQHYESNPLSAPQPLVF